MKIIEEKMPRLVAELHAHPLSRWGRAGVRVSASPKWERVGVRARSLSAKLEHLSAVALAKVEAIKSNLRGLGYGG